MSVGSWFQKNITRRQALKATSATLVAAGAAASLSGCGAKDENMEESVDDKSYKYVDILKTFKEEDRDIKEKDQLKGEVGTVFGNSSNENYLACLTPGENSANWIQGSYVNLDDNSFNVCVAQPKNADANWVIYQVACSESVYAWVELNILSNHWQLFAAPLQDKGLGTAMCLWKSTDQYEPPYPVCWRDKVMWLVMPDPKKDARLKPSACYIWSLGQNQAYAQVESRGRFACQPSVSEGLLVLTPRARLKRQESVNYSISVFNVDSNLATKVDALILPNGIKPLYATYINRNFVFSIEASYQSELPFARMGTYIGSKDGPFYFLNREPYAQVSGTEEGAYLIKSKGSYLVVDTSRKVYTTLDSQDRCTDYGEYPCTGGTMNTFVTYSTTKNEETGYPDSVTIRTFQVDSRT